MEYKEQIERYIEEHEAELIADVQELCRIKSVRGEAEPGKPYGPGPYEALMRGMEICGRYGFQTTNYDNYVAAADLNDGPKQLDILAHMDVVAEGEGWTVTEPYNPIVKDGKIYGRGTSDDKGPAMAALYAMRAVKELGLPLTKNCRLILGSDEECGSSDIHYYYQKETEAPMSFTPDAEFPLINAEKGQFRADIKKEVSVNESGAYVVSLAGGDTTNIVPGKAAAVVTGLAKETVEAACAALSAETGVQFSVEAADGADSPAGSLKILAAGEGAHAASPEKGKNAALALLKLMTKLPLSGSTQTEYIGKLAKLFPYGDHYGTQIGAKRCDEVSGDTTVSLNILNIDRNSIYAKFDSRSCVTANTENTVEPAKACMEAEGFSVETAFNTPHMVDADSAFVKTLLESYEAVTGEPGRAVAIGGGTYVHDLKRGVAFGAVGEFTDTHMHGADEFMMIEELKTAAKIFAVAIAELCR